jgi:hypothetical protein
MKRALLLSSLLCLSFGLSAQNEQQEPTKEEIMQYLQEVSTLANGFDHSFYIFKPQGESQEWQDFVKTADLFKQKVGTNSTLTSSILDEGMNLLKSAIAYGFVMQPSIELITEQPDLSSIGCNNPESAEIVVLAFDLLKNTKVEQEWLNFIVRSVDHAQQILGDESLPEEWLSMISTYLDTNLDNFRVSPTVSVIFLDAESLKEQE